MKYDIWVTPIMQIVIYPCDFCGKPAQMHEANHRFCLRCWREWVCEAAQE